MSTSTLSAPASVAANGSLVKNGVPREKLSEGARRFRDAYEIRPGAPLFRREFWYMPTTVEAWRKQGMPENANLQELFHLDETGDHRLGNLGWCEANFQPKFQEEVLEDRGETEVVRDMAGRHVLFFKNRRSGFMPEYLDHPVKDMATWERDVLWRLDPTNPQRIQACEKAGREAQAEAPSGKVISQCLIGGYMYLRSLMGPENLLYNVIDQPELIHACMRTWLALSDAVIAIHQKYVTLDEIFLAEDICYNRGSLISPDMMREFLIPYYQQLVNNVRSRQLDKNRHLFVQIDTDGDCRPVIDVYRESIGMDVMSPFEVASGCDVVEIGKRYPYLVMVGGLDKRELSKGPKAIDAMLERIIPAMRARGGYIPTIDHGVPEEVPYVNYLYYRKRCVELGG